jgi:hypothetical protein
MSTLTVKNFGSKARPVHAPRVGPARPGVHSLPYKQHVALGHVADDVRQKTIDSLDPGAVGQRVWRDLRIAEASEMFFQLDIG